MRKAIVAVVLFFLVFTVVPVGRASTPELLLEAKSAILLHAESSRVLYAKDAHCPMYPASATKIMTALLTLEYGCMNDMVNVGAEVGFTPEDGTLIDIKPGDKISVWDLLHGLLLRSGNDAAYTLGVYIARRVSGYPRLGEREAVALFIEQMNDRASQLGAKNTHFANPDGYHDSSHWTTAYDLALITREAMRNELLRRIAKTRSYQPNSWQRAGEQPEWKSGNRLLDDTKDYYVQGATGLKPGYTPEAGFCQVATATRENLNLISVVLDSSNKGRWADSKTLLEYGFSTYECVRVAQRGQPVAILSINKPLVSAAQVVNAREVCLAVKRGTGTQFQRDIRWLKTAVYQAGMSLHLQVPARQGMTVGKVVYSLDGEQPVEVDLVLGEFLAGWLKYVIVVVAWVLLAGASVTWLGRR